MRIKKFRKFSKKFLAQDQDLVNPLCCQIRCVIKRPFRFYNIFHLYDTMFLKNKNFVHLLKWMKQKIKFVFFKSKPFCNGDISFFLILFTILVSLIPVFIGIV